MFTYTYTYMHTSMNYPINLKFSKFDIQLGVRLERDK